MEIRNEEHAREMLLEWGKMPLPLRIKEIRLAIEQLELNSMYYEQKGNEQGVKRTERCARILSEHLKTLD
ncbi:MAG: hypothetical protein Kow0089_20030 [Desulfobulbaceae bacterium]